MKQVVITFLVEIETGVFKPMYKLVNGTYWVTTENGSVKHVDNQLAQELINKK